jgi:hypothetical protein
MFKKLFSSVQGRFQEKQSDHPLGSAASLADVIAGVSRGDAMRQLFEIDEFLADTETTLAEIGVEAALRAVQTLDEAAQEGQAELLLRYLTPGRYYLADSVWAVLDTHAGHLFTAYRLVQGAMPPPQSSGDKQTFSRLTVRSLRAWALRKKLQYFRFRPIPESSWQAANELMRQTARLGLSMSACIAYPEGVTSTALREYLAGVYLDLAPVGSLNPQQVEFVDRFLRAPGTAETLEFAVQPGVNSTHRLDLALPRGPVRSKDGPTEGGELRFLGTARPRAALLKQVASLKTDETLPEWLRGLPINAELRMATIQALVLNWAPTPPQRSAARVPQAEQMRVVFGFGMARRMIAASHFARMGRSVDYDGSDVEQQFQEYRFGKIDTEAEIKAKAAAAAMANEPKIVNPMVVLQRLELLGEQAQMESWTQIDSSESGFGALIPAVLPRHRIGALIAVRFVEGIQWRLGLIRRLGRDAQNRPTIGIEALDWPSLCATARMPTEMDALLVSHTQTQMILPEQTFREGLEVAVFSEESRLRVRLTKLLDRGADYDRIEFQTIPAEEKTA